MSQSQPLTIAQIKELPVGSPVPLVVGTLVSIFDYKTNVGRNDSTIQSAMLKDDTGEEIRINIWNQQDYKARKGAAVRIIGVFEKGKCSTHVIENKHFNPPAIELQLSKSTVILISGANVPAPAAKQATPEPDQAAPSGEQTEGAAPPPERPPAAASRGPRPVNGQTVGNAMKLAIDIVTKAFEEDKSEAKTDEMTFSDFIQLPEFSIQIHQQASDLIRIAQRLEKGYLAPTVRERHRMALLELSGEQAAPAEPPPPQTAPPAEPPKKPAKPAPGPDGQAYTPGNEDEDVPF
jgi:hypothetical protein